MIFFLYIFARGEVSHDNPSFWVHARMALKYLF